MCGRGIKSRTVFSVEAVKAVEGVPMSMHIQGIDRQVVCRQVERFEDLPEAKVFVVSESDRVIGTPLHLGLDEAQ
jgi:hypothetical protein